MDPQQFVALVSQMREAQRGFFREKKAGNRQTANDYLKQSISLEEKVDKEIARIQIGQTTLDLG